jgi:putative glycosyltransferase (TIGR04372 family)
MNLRTVKKKFRQEVLVDNRGQRISNTVVIRKFILLCAKAAAGLVLSIFLGPISLIYPIEIWLMSTRLSKISFFIQDLEMGLRELQSRNLGGKVWVIALYPIEFPNKYLVEQYRRHVTLLGKNQKWIAEAIRFVVPFFRIYRKRVNDRSSKKFEIWNSGSPTLRFNRDEIEHGEKLESDLKLDQKFVCFAISSKLYRSHVDLAQVALKKSVNQDLISTIPDISNYFALFNELAKNSLSVLRMGIFEDSSLPACFGQSVIDYAFSNRSEFGDVWLASRCHYFSTAGAGAWWLGAIFGKRTVATDIYSLRGTSGMDDLFIPQLAKFERSLEFAGFSWMAANDEWAFDQNKLGREYSIIKNTPQQIIDVNLEMIMRLSGNWVETDEDVDLQRRFRSCQNLYRPADRSPAKIGAKFLREHQHLLPD